jgi:hypothetical protein
MAINNIPGVGPANSDVAAAVAAAVPTNSSIAAAVPTNSSIATAVAAAVPTNTSITNIVQTYAAAKATFMAEYNSSTNWTAPTGTNWVRVEAVGGGGGSGGSGWFSNWWTSGGTYYHGPGSGAGGQVVDTVVSVTPGTTYAVTIGAAGAGAAITVVNNTNGPVNSTGPNAGGDTQLGNLVIAYGGSSGSSAGPTSGGNAVVTRYGGTGTGADSSVPHTYGGWGSGYELATMALTSTTSPLVTYSGTVGNIAGNSSLSTFSSNTQPGQVFGAQGYGPERWGAGGMQLTWGVTTGRWRQGKGSGANASRVSLSSSSSGVNQGTAGQAGAMRLTWVA